MGGRGATSSLGRGGVKSVVTQGGVTVDLSDNPLIYGKNDSALTGAKRQIIDDFEKRRGKSKIEYGILVDKDGNVITEERGGKKKVSYYNSDLAKAEVLSHIHPRGKGDEDLIGGTFSNQDMKVFTDFGNIKTFRAKATEGTYSITKGKNFDAKGFMDYINSSEKEAKTKMNGLRSQINENYRSGKYNSYGDYKKDFNNAFNNYLVNSHNALSSGAKKYGYTYTLERKK